MATNSVQALATNVLGPRIQFATPVYDFGKVKSGESAKYTYLYTNIGDQVLEISNVQACGCIASTDWRKKIEPGQTGALAIQYNSAGYPSGPVAKTITVTSNDKRQPYVVLQLKGAIWKPIDVTPSHAILNLLPDSPAASATVRIINNLEELVTLFAPESNQRAFAAELKTNQPGKEYSLTVTTAEQLRPGNTSGQITMKTSSTNVPLVTVTAVAYVQPAVLVSPPQINLPPAPLANAQTNLITLQNNSTNRLLLSEPLINAKDVDVQIVELNKEQQPGRLFNLRVAFPAGFEAPAGVPVVLSLKSSHPQVPLIKVPVVQPRRLASQSQPSAPAAPSPPPPPE